MAFAGLIGFGYCCNKVNCLWVLLLAIYTSLNTFEEEKGMQRITIFGRNNCGFCRQAKSICELNSLEYRYLDIEAEGIARADLEKTVGKAVTTVPQIFCGREYVGGFQELEAMLAREAKAAIA